MLAAASAAAPPTIPPAIFAARFLEPLASECLRLDFPIDRIAIKKKI